MSLLRTPSKGGNHLNIQQLGPNEAADLCAVIHLTAELRNGMDRVAGAADSVETPRRPSPQTPPSAPPGGAQASRET
ncbi:hypothetical protein ATANTOWER_012892 [Ataeniobius toweri]|uniref:Uncharacterized protein n=1 Tax=Ataeniobius toweri TaxID=208326 RepID=A0ABU7BZ15_9TELE|nr:hypothetical protein [Ataeniobius toweri]